MSVAQQILSKLVMYKKLAISETVSMAITTLRSNRLRSLLTMLGIVIGNASVITLVGVGRGAQNLAKNQLSNLGANVLFVVPGNNDTRRRGVAFPRNLVLEDSDAIATQVPTVKRVAPQISSNEVVQFGPESSTSSVSGITPNFWASMDMLAGKDEWVFWGTPNCGKGQPGQVGHTGHPASPARFKNVRIGVKG